MRDADAFAETVFLGLSKRARRDPYRLGLFARHLEPDERPRVVLAIQGGTLVVTDRRILELRAHLEVHGAWNVKEFQGYVAHRAMGRATVRDVAHRVTPSDTRHPTTLEDTLLLTTSDGVETFLVSRGPEATLPPEDFDLFRAEVLAQAK